MKYMDVIPPKVIKQRRLIERERYLINKFVSNLKYRGGIVGDKAVLVVYDKICPERSYFLVEDI